jgi:cephalosporin hydroxylase
MKNYEARAGATLTLDNQGERSTVDLYSEGGFEMLSNLWIKVAAEQKQMYHTTWLGRPVIQFPSDVVMIQELIWKVRPDVIVETGVAHGGSLILSASILELIGAGKVIGVDIEIRPHNRTAIEEHPLSPRITLIEGSSIDPKTVDAVRAALDGAKSVMVVLDSNHSYAHVLNELKLYSPLVTPGSYLVAHDGAQAWVWDMPRGKPEWKDDHPLRAIYEFIESNPQFRIDQECTRFGITSSPDGYLRRLTQTEIQGGTE